MSIYIAHRRRKTSNALFYLCAESKVDLDNLGFDSVTVLRGATEVL